MQKNPILHTLALQPCSHVSANNNQDPLLQTKQHVTAAKSQTAFICQGCDGAHTRWIDLCNYIIHGRRGDERGGLDRVRKTEGKRDGDERTTGRQREEDERRQEYDRARGGKIKDEERPIISGRYQEWIFHSFLFWGGKTDEGQSEMDGRRQEEKKRSMLEGVVKRWRWREGGGKTGSRRRRYWLNDEI